MSKNQYKESLQETLTYAPVGMVVPTLLGGFFGFTSDNFSVYTGLFWGAIVGVGLIIVYGAGSLIYKWFETEMNKGRLLPYTLIGFVIAIVASGSLAISLGSPTCLDVEYDNRGGVCQEYANDGYDPASNQRWAKFWSTLPFTIGIASFIAYRVHSAKHKKKD